MRKMQLKGCGRHLRQPYSVKKTADSLVCTLRLCTELSKLARRCAAIATSQTLHDIAHDLDLGAADALHHSTLIRSSRNDILRYHAAGFTCIHVQSIAPPSPLFTTLGTPPP
jgi:hypothetical protein